MGSGIRTRPRPASMAVSNWGRRVSRRVRGVPHGTPLAPEGRKSMRTRALLWLAVCAALAACGSGAVSTLPSPSPSPSSSPSSSPPPLSQFVQTAAVLYGNFAVAQPEGCFPLDLGAKFDLVDTSLSNAHRWCGRPANPFLELKRRNPRMTVVLYHMGLNSYKVGSDLGPGWDWLRTNHGRDSPDRWTNLGVETGEYLVHINYPVERAMILGNRNWQQAWVTWTLEHLDQPGAQGADGIFADVMSYHVGGTDRWCPESRWRSTGDGRGTCERTDLPSAYYDPNTGRYNHDLYRQHYREFLDMAIPQYRSRGRRFSMNVWALDHPGQAPLYNSYGDLIVMVERGFVWWDYYNRDQITPYWLRTLDAIRNATGYKVLVVNGVDGDASRNMDALYGYNTGWQWLWFSLMSYLLGYNPQTRNAYFHFVVFDNLAYNHAMWFDEYDPRYLHLGRPLAPAYQTGSGAWLREFERGWAAVNPTDNNVEVLVPQGRARVLDHDNFKTPEAAQPVDRVTLPRHRWVVLLR